MEGELEGMDGPPPAPKAVQDAASASARTRVLSRCRMRGSESEIAFARVSSHCDQRSSGLATGFRIMPGLHPEKIMNKLTRVPQMLLAGLLMSLAVQAYAADAAIDASIASTERTQADRDRDVREKPAEVLAFAGVKPGMTVADLFSAGGYYTE